MNGFFICAITQNFPVVCIKNDVVGKGVLAGNDFAGIDVDQHGRYIGFIRLIQVLFQCFKIVCGFEYI